MARRGSGRSRPVSWQTTAIQINATDLAQGTTAASTVLSPGGASSVCLRTHGQLLFQLDVGAVDERAIIAWGLIVAPENALGVGVSALPHPFTDGEDDWYAHGYATLSSLAEAAVQADALFHRVTIDSKAMRKLKPTEGVAFVMEVAQSVDGTGTFDVLGGLRSLQSVA